MNSSWLILLGFTSWESNKVNRKYSQDSYPYNIIIFSPCSSSSREFLLFMFVNYFQRTSDVVEKCGVNSLVLLFYTILFLLFFYINTPCFFLNIYLYFIRKNKPSSAKRITQPFLCCARWDPPGSKWCLVYSKEEKEVASSLTPIIQKSIHSCSIPH